MQKFRAVAKKMVKKFRGCFFAENKEHGIGFKIKHSKQFFLLAT